MILDSALKSSMKTLPDCVFAAYLDLEMGMVLASEPRAYFESDIVDGLAVAAVNLLEGRHVLQLERMLSEGAVSTQPPEHFNDALSISAEHIHLFLRLPENESHVVCYVCKKSASAEAALSAGRVSLQAYAGIFQAG